MEFARFLNLDPVAFDLDRYLTQEFFGSFHEENPDARLSIAQALGSPQHTGYAHEAAGVLFENLF